VDIRVDSEAKELKIDFDGRTVPYAYPELDEVILAYAISVTNPREVNTRWSSSL